MAPVSLFLPAPADLPQPGRLENILKIFHSKNISMLQPAIAVPLVFVPGSDRWALISPNAEINVEINLAIKYFVLVLLLSVKTRRGPCRF